MDKEQKHSLYRISAAALGLGAGLLGGEQAPGPRLLLLAAAYLLVGGPVLLDAGRNILRGQLFDECFLMSLATLGAIALGEYPEAVAVMLLYQVGELCQDVAVDRSRRSIAGLLDLRPDRAVLLLAGEETPVTPQEVQPGQLILVRPGERVPLDGVIRQGRSSLDLSALTGESLPVDLGPGETVVSGAVNLSSPLVLRVTSPYSQSTLARILELVENSSQRKARSESFITRFARVYTPAVVAAALLLALLPPLLLAQPWSVWLNRALIFLVVSCPCALVISVPLSFFRGLGLASSQGILVKGSNYLEALARADIMAFDKTGTLTQGRFQVQEVRVNEKADFARLGAMDENRLLQLAAAAESYSSHPLAACIQAAAYQGDEKAREEAKKRVSQVQDLAGLGLSCRLEGLTLLVGNTRLLDQAQVDWKECGRTEATAVHVAVNGIYAGYIAVADQIKPQTAEALRQLRQLGLSRLVMLSGDRRAVGRAVGEALGLDEVRAELSPQGKLEAAESLLSQVRPGKSFVYAGDGINDAPLLARADVGVAMGALGAEAAIEAADVVLMDDDPLKLARGVQIARRTLTIVRQNIILALGVKAAVLLLGALGLANIWLAVFADVGVSLLAVLNAMRSR